MYDGSRILPGLGTFLVLATFPVWHGLAAGRSTAAPKLAKPVQGTECVLDRREIRRSHMQLLVSWRDEVVREGRRVHVSASGRQYEKHLTGTCLRCHPDRAGFCDRCHNYVQTTPHCWECHVDPKGGW